MLTNRHSPVWYSLEPALSGLSERQLTAIAELGYCAAGPGAGLAVAERAVALVSDVLAADICGVFEFDPDSRSLRLITGSGWRDKPAGLFLSNFATHDEEFTLLFDGPAVVEYGSPDSAIQVSRALMDCGAVSGVGVAIMDSAGLCGLIGVFQAHPRRFRQDEVSFLQVVARVLSQRMEDRRPASVSQDGSHERAALLEISRAITASPRIGDVFEAVAGKVKEVLPADYVAIWTADESLDELTVACSSGFQIPGLMEGDRFNGRELTSHMNMTRTGLLVMSHGAPNPFHYYPELEGMVEAGVNDAIITPLISQNSLAGLFVVATRRKGLSHHHIRLNERIASQLAGPVANSLLLRRVEHACRLNNVLAQVSRIVDSTPNVNTVYERFASCVKSLVQFDCILLLGLNEDMSAVESLYTAGVEVPNWRPDRTTPLPGTLMEVIRESRTGFIFNRDCAEGTRRRFSSLTPGAEIGLVSSVAAPLVTEGAVIGYLMLRSMKECAYTHQDLATLSAVASQIAGAIARARLITQTERHARFMAVLAEIGYAMTRAKSLPVLLDSVRRALKEHVRFEQMAVDLIDPETDSLVRLSSSSGVTEPWQTTNIGSVSGERLRWNQQGTEEHMESPAQTAEDGDGPLLFFDSCAIPAAVAQTPLYSRGDVIGKMVLWGRPSFRFTSENMTLLQKVAAHVAPAIESIRQHELIQQQAQESKVLAEIGSVTQSSLDIDDWYSRFAELVGLLIPFDRIAVTTIDVAAGTATDSYQAGVVLSDRPIGLVREIVGTANEVLLRTGAGVRLDMREETSPYEWYEEMRRRMTGAGLWSRLCVPLISRYNTHAILHLSSKKPGAYSDRDLKVAERIANQVSGAIVNSAEYFQVLRMVNGQGQVPGQASQDIATAQNGAWHANVTGSQPTPAAGLLRIPIMVVGAEELSRRALAVLLNSTEVEVIAECGTGPAAQSVIRAAKPRVVLLEARLLDEEVLSFAAQARAASPMTRVILLGASSTPAELSVALKEGFAGFLPHKTTPAHLMDSIKHVAEGGTVVEPRMLTALMSEFPSTGSETTERDRDLLAKLSDSERDILAALARGLTNSEIAAEMSFAPGTVKNRVGRMYRTLGVRDRAQAAALAVRCGLIE